MNRLAARPPISVPELCLVRLGFQARGISGALYASRVRREALKAEAEAIRVGVGLMHAEHFRLGRGHFGVIQYWRSFQDLEAWSRRPPHAEWWRDALQRMRTRGDFGVYHEVYLVPRERVEGIALNCTPAGLFTFGESGEPTGPDANARGRLRLAR